MGGGGGGGTGVIGGVGLWDVLQEGWGKERRSRCQLRWPSEREVIKMEVEIKCGEQMWEF